MNDILCLFQWWYGKLAMFKDVVICFEPYLFFHAKNSLLKTQTSIIYTKGSHGDFFFSAYV